MWLLQAWGGGLERGTGVQAEPLCVLAIRVDGNSSSVSTWAQQLTNGPRNLSGSVCGDSRQAGPKVDGDNCVLQSILREHVALAPTPALQHGL